MNSGISHYVLFFPLLFCIMASTYYCLAVYAALDHRSQSSPFNPTFHPPISPLKPIFGLDSHAYENLAPFCYQDYPDYQVIFGVQDATEYSMVLQVCHGLVGWGQDSKRSYCQKAAMVGAVERSNEICTMVL